MRRARSDESWLLVASVGALALFGFLMLGEAVRAHQTLRFDTAVQAWVRAHQVPVLGTIFAWITTLGGIMGMRVLAVAGGAYLWLKGRRSAAVGALVPPVVASMLFTVTKRIYGRPRPLGQSGTAGSDYSFPSGHATVSAAVCCALAYLLWRERLIGRHTALALGAIPPLLVGASRSYLDVHWATDVFGGWCAGLFIAGLCTALYERYGRARVVTS